jgi:SAM-dependent methyltransferase
MITEAAEREKYRKIWAVPAYRNYSPGEQLVDTFLQTTPWHKGDSLIDIGCGTGRAGLKLRQAGLKVTLFDLCFEAPDKEATKHLPMMQGNIWDFTYSNPWDWIYCTDMLEHIPTEYVDAALDNMAELTGKGGFLQIALYQDGFGRQIGETLHLTVESADWWLAKIGKRWRIAKDSTRHPYPPAEATNLLVTLGVPYVEKKDSE